MSKGNWGDFWWNNITGPQTVIKQVVNTLLENRLVLLLVPDDLPFRHAMRECVSSLFQRETKWKNAIIDEEDMADENQEKLEPGRFILKKYAPDQVRNNFRERTGKTIQDYIVKNEVLKDRILWIKGLDETDSDLWIKFCQNYRPESICSGLIVVEIHTGMGIRDTRNLKCIRYEDCISEYDVQLFNSYILDGEYFEYPDVWKKYISCLTAQVCGTDAEISACLIQNTDFRIENLYDGIRRTAENPAFERRGKRGDSRHLLWEYRNEQYANINKRIWAAQVQILFPLIEMEKIQIVEIYQKDIQNVLDNDDIEQYGSRVQDLADVELGTLKYMMSWKAHDGEETLYFPDENVRGRILFLHSCRNTLAHAKCCEFEDVKLLLEKGLFKE